MAKVIAHVRGVALAPGVSRNGRLYTADVIGKAVERAKGRLGDGGMPITQRTHHAAGDDSEKLVGHLTSLSHAEDGSAPYEAVLVDTAEGRKLLELIDDSDGPAVLRGVSIRGAWVGPVKKRTVDGALVEYAEDLELDGLDYTATPGVTGARIDQVTRVADAMQESAATGRTVIYETVQEALVVTEHVQEAAPGGGTKAIEPAPSAARAVVYADPGYLAPGDKRLPLGSLTETEHAWWSIQNPDVAGAYSAAQLKRMKGRVVKELTGHGVNVTTEGYLARRSTTPAVAESGGEVREHCSCCSLGYGGDEGKRATMYVSLSNGTVNVSVSSYCLDPHDLDRVGRAAMAGAAATIASTDTEMTTVVPVEGGQPATETTAPQAAPAAEVAGELPATPAPDQAADSHQEQEASDVSEPTTTPAEPTAAPATAPAPTTTTSAAPAPPAGLTLTDEQFKQWLAAQTPAQPAAAQPAEATAPANEPAMAGAPTEAAPAAPVTETSALDPAAIAKLVNDSVTAALQGHVAQNGPPQRKGLVENTNTPPGTPAGTGPAGAAVEHGVPGIPADLQPHEFRPEHNEALNQHLERVVMGSRSVANTP